MKVLLHTNIVIHREATTVVNEDIGVLFRWLDNLHYTKCIHPVSVDELGKHKDPRVLKTFKAKTTNYNVLKTKAPISDAVRQISDHLDEGENDLNDTLIISKLYSGKVDDLITEDRKLIHKASLLGIADRVYTIDAFLEKVTAENPDLADYKVFAVQKDHFGNLDITDEFFASLKEDYPGFENWFNRKADGTVYVCRSEGKPIALLYLKVEGQGADYSDINPPFSKRKRLKIGTFKVALNGFRLGERFLKVVFDNALRFDVDEIYVTTFSKRIEQQRLINLFEEYGRAFDKDHYTKMIIPYLGKFGEAKRGDIDKLLLDKLSEALTDKQRDVTRGRSHVNSLFQCDLLIIRNQSHPSLRHPPLLFLSSSTYLLCRFSAQRCKAALPICRISSITSRSASSAFSTSPATFSTTRSSISVRSRNNGWALLYPENSSSPKFLPQENQSHFYSR